MITKLKHLLLNRGRMSLQTLHHPISQQSGEGFELGLANRQNFQNRLSALLLHPQRILLVHLLEAQREDRTSNRSRLKY